MRWVRFFHEVGLEDVPLVGGKNASLGEMIRELSPLGVRVPEGFATTSEAYWHFLEHNGLKEAIARELGELDPEDPKALQRVSRRLRNLILKGEYPQDLREEILEAYRRLSEEAGEEEIPVAVRSSATAEDLPTASFAGQQESFLYVQGEADLLLHVKRAMASLFTARAISYRAHMGFDHLKVALSVGVQRMVRADDAASGVIFTLDPDTGHRGFVYLTAIYGLGENIVQGRVIPDGYYVHKETFREGFRAVVYRRLGAKELTLAFDPREGRLKNRPTPLYLRNRFALRDEEVLLLADWAMKIEDHYSKKRGSPTPMDIEWAKDGPTGELFVLQARPETVHSQKTPVLRVFRLLKRGEVLAEGLAVGEAIAMGRARVLKDPKEMDRFQEGEVLVTETTNPDWEPIMKKAAAIVTERGGRTSHAAIVARELGVPAVVGAVGATRSVPEGEEVTVSCAEGERGVVYRGRLPFEVEEIRPETLPRTRTRILVNVGTPEEALRTSLLPTDGVGLLRMEFVFASHVRVHPLALTRFETLPKEVRRQVEEVTEAYPDKRAYFVETLSQGIGLIAAAFYPRPVLLRFSDFKTNEYARLLGGHLFEPKEENPMLGWRGASRYYHPDYKEGFLLEVAAVRRVREEMGLKNLMVMVPFCRTPEEGEKVLEVMAEGGLRRGEGGLEVHVMAEIPSNVLEAEAFAELFDGFSIGSNDLTQLALGLDRDSERVAHLFDERRETVKRLAAMLIEKAHAKGKKVGICGQAPSDYPEFAAFLVERGIDSLSLNPDALLRTVREVAEVERRLGIG
ncbi:MULTISPECIES: phosphoenolpyruvate synthase [Thermus]|uniref:Phosphoenolpyruvate synthase n=1 Tax=Thermus thermophilus (strain ATCC 27634 / DSM 579 / HB8) TaxID=300852 RepID=Q5SI74_THET8|nr:MULTISPECIES: phosphoenolpyruvate synthase [Thermus]QZY58087.1 phosphoenolpyruvate synthase [Thermus thermophilus]BAD71323.1 phosphoenolpyruvate synthase [Thermus thermophilus HB8]BDA38116.1 phosphoenolpyruvate synthase [Thermus thermophilus]BDE45841.1 phosphoenolpyruvate synthase [Thermus thermophilus]HAH40427.1 phosphoenolpyruvate synthase [Thermus sp.]